MSDHAGFLRAIAENVYDDAPRLIYADWLDEQGEPERAEFIRLQCELEPNRDRYEVEGVEAMHRREDELHRAHEKHWLGNMPPGWDDRQTGASIQFRRGVPDTLSLPARTFLDFGGSILRSHPTIRRVQMFRVNGYGERLAVCESLAGVRELDLACWYAREDAEAIGRSAFLGHLQGMTYWLGSQHDGTDEVYCRLFASSGAWPKLSKFTLLHPFDEREPAFEELVGIVNVAAGREIGTYRYAFPEVFPLAADINYSIFPGYLSDGRSAVASWDTSTYPPTLLVATFDGDGRQTTETIRVPFPEELFGFAREEQFRHTASIAQQLVEMIDFRPGFIRIREAEFPGRAAHIWPSWHYLEEIGRLDDDSEESWRDHTNGFGGYVCGFVENQEWMLDWGGWGDKTGRIHST